MWDSSMGITHLRTHAVYVADAHSVSFAISASLGDMATQLQQ
jgi:hypothetical protein